jgi:hypothetical protein
MARGDDGVNRTEMLRPSAGQLCSPDFAAQPRKGRSSHEA